MKLKNLRMRNIVFLKHVIAFSVFIRYGACNTYLIKTSQENNKQEEITPGLQSNGPH